MLHKEIKNLKDFLELLIFLLISPIIGIIMLIGMVATPTNITIPMIGEIKRKISSSKKSLRLFTFLCNIIY